MTPAERRMLEFLGKSDGMSAGAIGASIYCSGRMPQAYARPATNVLNRLARQGFVARRSRGYWFITWDGFHALQSPPEPARARDWIGRRVRLVREIWTKGGRTYDNGSRWMVESTWRGGFVLYSLWTNRLGFKDRVGHVSRTDFEEVIP